MQNFDAEIIQNLRKKFEKSYVEFNDPKTKNKSDKNLEKLFHELIILTLRHEIDLQMRIWKIKLTETEKQEMKESIVKQSAHVHYQILDGKLQETCFDPWVCEKLPKIEKFDQIKFESKSPKKQKETIEKYKKDAYQNAIKMINAHFFGMLKSRPEIEELKNQKNN